MRWNVIFITLLIFTVGDLFGGFRTEVVATAYAIDSRETTADRAESEVQIGSSFEAFPGLPEACPLEAMEKEFPGYSALPRNIEGCTKTCDDPIYLACTLDDRQALGLCNGPLGRISRNASRVYSSQRHCG